MVCIKEMCAMRVKFSRKHKFLEIRHFFFHICVQCPKHSLDFQKDMSHLHLIVRTIIEMRGVLEKTLESPLDCKEIQPVLSEGDQPWDFFGGNDAEAETPVLWPPHVKS